MYSTRASRHVRATPTCVYRALTNGELLARWRTPHGMESHVHEFDAREGGAIRVSLTYDDTAEAGKLASHTDTYSGRFVRLVEGEQVVEAFEFETGDPGLRGEMTMTTTITPTATGCLVEMFHERVLDAVPPADNELGMHMALDRLASLVEGKPRDPE